MRLIPTASCRPGLRLGKPIYSDEGLVLLGQRVELTQHLIKRLQQLGIDYIYIEDPDTDDIEIREPISDETRLRAYNEIRATFRKVMEDSIRQKSSKSFYMGKAFVNVMSMIIDDLMANPGVITMLTNIFVTNTYLYRHSLNVAIYTTMLGIAHGYPRDDLMVLGLGALLHDIGKTQINLDILNKPGPLSEEEYNEVKKHAEYGFKLLKDEPGIPLLAAHCALQHHERLDGSGYPRGLKDKEIHDYAKWIAITDSYDAMTSHRPHRPAMLPHQAMEVLFSGVGTLYEHGKVAAFRDNVAIYPLGATVTLNTGEKGVVSRINPAIPQRPTVRVLYDADGQRVAQPYELELASRLTVMIESVGEM